jgi:hypothetical protein
MWWPLANPSPNQRPVPSSHVGHALQEVSECSRWTGPGEQGRRPACLYEHVGFACASGLDESWQSTVADGQQGCVYTVTSGSQNEIVSGVDDRAEDRTLLRSGLDTLPASERL